MSVLFFVNEQHYFFSFAFPYEGRTRYHKKATCIKKNKQSESYSTTNCIFERNLPICLTFQAKSVNSKPLQ